MSTPPSPFTIRRQLLRTLVNEVLVALTDNHVEQLVNDTGEQDEVCLIAQEYLPVTAQTRFLYQLSQLAIRHALLSPDGRFTTSRPLSIQNLHTELDALNGFSHK